MAITNNDLKFLFYCRTKGVEYINTLTLGRLFFYGTADYLKKLSEEKLNKNADEFKLTDGYSEPVFAYLGAEQTDSMDFSDYEKATITHDLNLPVDLSLHRKYSAVVDGGTLEHVFNFPVAIANCMNMIKDGGHYIGITPANNLMGHGFYQFSPELYFRIFSPANGFVTISMMITSSDEKGDPTTWYEIQDPEKIKERIVLSNSFPVYLMILAKKISHQPVFASMPQQSDYQLKWQKFSEPEDSVINQYTSIYRKLIPKKLRDIIYAIRKQAGMQSIQSGRLGQLNKNHFRESDF